MVRSQFDEAARFYFDSIVDGGVALDLQGELTVSPSGEAMRVTSTTRSRVVRGGTVSTGVPVSGGLMGARKVESTVRLAPGEVVAIELPRLSKNDAGAFANHTFSIRVRSRQIR